jgi:Amt family ammonium transporter
MVGALLTGVLAQQSWKSPADGLLFGNPGQFVIQAVAVVATIGFTAVGTVAILFAMRLVAPIRAAARDEGVGLDVSQHGEEAYGRGDGAVLVLPGRRMAAGTTMFPATLEPQGEQS